MNIRYVASGSGRAYWGLVLTYPDGHSRTIASGTMTAGDSGESQRDGLPSGNFTYTLYATPLDPDEAGTDSPDKRLRSDPVAKGTFAIP